MPPRRSSTGGSKAAPTPPAQSEIPPPSGGPDAPLHNVVDPLARPTPSTLGNTEPGTSSSDQLIVEMFGASPFEPSSASCITFNTPNPFLTPPSRVSNSFSGAEPASSNIAAPSTILFPLAKGQDIVPSSGLSPAPGTAPTATSGSSPALITSSGQILPDGGGPPAAFNSPCSLHLSRPSTATLSPLAHLSKRPQRPRFMGMTPSPPQTHRTPGCNPCTFKL